MAIGGIQGGIGSFAPRPTRPEDAAAGRTIPERPVPAPPTPAAAQQGSAADDAGIPIEAPPGTDPTLWSVLTAEERRHFAKLQALGPLTYGPRPAAQAQPLARGGRIDMTV